MEKRNKIRYIDVPVLEREIARSIVEREYSNRISGGIYKLDENNEEIKDSEGKPIYNDAAAVQMYHLLIFYSGMIRDHLEEPEEPEEVAEIFIYKEKSITTKILDWFKALFLF